ncbi:MAG: GNAT family N-acetyltransferase [Rickettsiales bacterium]|jgi:predicted acetyltransferase|nr:GNAT family N-acetyltransferase [Rickettsiales bacterium]
MRKSNASGKDEKIRLESPNLKYRETYLDAVAEFAERADPKNSTEAHYKKITAENFDAMVAKRLREMTEPDEGRVPATTFWIMRGDRYVGRIQLRHNLNGGILANYGGHIGYDIRPSERGRGHSKAALRLCLAEAKKIGLPEIFITCLDWNEPSHRTILGAVREYGGREAEPYADPETGGRFLRFWINTGKKRTLPKRPREDRGPEGGARKKEPEAGRIARVAARACNGVPAEK